MREARDIANKSFRKTVTVVDSLKTERLSGRKKLRRMLENDHESKRQCKLTEAAQKQLNSPATYEEFNFHCKKLQELFYDVLGAHNESSALCEGYEKQSSKYKALEVKNHQLAEQLKNCEHERGREAAKKSAFKTIEEVDGSLNDLLQEFRVEFDTDASLIEKIGHIKEVFTVYQKEIDDRANDIEKLQDQLDEASNRTTNYEQQGSLIHSLLTSCKQKDEEITHLQTQVAQMERKLQETRCFTEELMTYKEDMERYRDAYGRAVAEKDSLVKKYDEEQQKWSLKTSQMRRALLEAEQRQVASQRSYDELLKTWQKYESSGEQGLNDRIQELQTQASVMKKALEEKDQQLTEVRRMNEDFESQLELLPPLRAQLEVYSSDYDTEKEQTANAQAQIAELQERLQELRNENVNLVSQLRGRQPAQSDSTMPSNSQATKMVDGLSCLLCTTKCATQQAYIDHVQACVEATEPSGP